jgi:hypothetical protein
MRIQRRFADRLLSLFRPVYRYQCSTLECGWQGNLTRGRLSLHDRFSPMATPTGIG